MRLNLLTVCTDAYPVEYARILISQIKKLSDYDIDAYCLTDRPQQVERFATPIVPKFKANGWWNKPLLFSDKIARPGWNLYMDIDIVAVRNFDEVIRAVIDSNLDDHIHCVSDAIGWMGNKFSSSWMMFHSGYHGHIAKRMVEEYSFLQHFKGGDQVWIGKEIQPLISYVDESFPFLKKNLKFDMGIKVFDQWKFPDTIDPRIALVDCGGRPKPHDLQQLDYIRQNWHDVRKQWL